MNNKKSNKKSKFVERMTDNLADVILLISGIGGFYLIALLFFHDIFLNAVWWKMFFVSFAAFSITPICVTVAFICDSKKGKTTHETTDVSVSGLKNNRK